MPQDPGLYGQRQAKKQKTEMGLSNTLDFTAQLQSLIHAKKSNGAQSASTKASSKRKTEPETSHDDTSGKGRGQAGKQAGTKLVLGKGASGSSGRKGAAGTASADLSDGERERIRQNMDAKARRYAMMQRGDYMPREGEGALLVDFDRKWAEKQDSKRRRGESSQDDDSDSDRSSGQDDNTSHREMVEHVDEFGRTRLVSRAERDRDIRRRERAARASRDLEEARARPAPPPSDARLIYGDVIQTEAIETVLDGRENRQGGKDGDGDDDNADSHYRAEDDVRTRGAAFYAFATGDEQKRAAQMQALAAERARTEAARAERGAQLEARRQEIAARRAALAERKAKKQADSFLDGLEKDLFAGGEGEA